MDQDRRDFLRGAARAGAVALAGSTLARAAPALARGAPTRESAPVSIAPMTIAECSRQLAAGTLTSRQLVERALRAIDDPQGEGARAFLVVHRQAALAAADRVDARRRAGDRLHALAGIPLSLKDLFDEAGVVTRGGSTVLSGAAPAARDSAVVERLRKAGAVIVGRTNLTEFAYSGLGINPHYGTPRNAFDRAAGRVPGGSSSGAAVSVADGMAAGAIGTDTGGSVRIPAALNGLVGFKPTAHRVPLEGALPLSYTLDSAGPIARSVADCVTLDRVLSGDAGAPAPVRLRGLRLAVPTTVFHDELAPDVARAFAAALARLSAAGAVVAEVPMREIADAAAVSPRGALASAEAFAVHRRWLTDGAAEYDPRVLSRIRPGEALSAADYIDLLQLRRRFVRTIAAASRDYDALLMPTTPDSAPTIAEASRDDAAYFRYNTRMLRNTAIVNLFDGCALSIPCHEPGAAPVGLMVAGPQDADRRVLAVGLAIEDVVRGRT
jgi:aspartyl-tRNA(Asn)/glutamyl-tRNA(Gln) amidotransferase subunit A